MSSVSIKPTAAPKNPYLPKPNLRIWFDGELVSPEQAKVSVFDHGLLYGDGIFEGIRIYKGRIFKEEEHLRRFFQSAKAIRLQLPYNEEGVSDAMHQTMEANGVTGDGYIRLVATRGVGSLGISIVRTACPSIIVIVDTISLYAPEVYQRGLRCIVSSITRNHPNSTSPRVKSLNYLNNVMAKLEAHDAGVDEAIMLNHQGYISECTGDNIFLVRDGVLLTPPATAGILEGVTRGVVMELAARRGHSVREVTLERHDLWAADECFATGTAAEIVPIVEVNKRPIGDGKPGPIAKQLMHDFIAYREAV